MRYYRIEIDGIDPITSFANGSTNPNALQVLMDLPVAPFATPADSGAFVKIWGLGLPAIRQSRDLRFKSIKVYGGFQKGLPLAKPQLSGLLVQGFVFQPFGNWIGTEQSLDLYVLGGPPPPDVNNPTKPRNIVLNWKQGQSLKDALTTTLTTAFPGYTSQINISDRLKLAQDDTHAPESFDALASYVRQTSKSIIGTDTYPGVGIALRDKVFYVYDNTPASGSTTTKTVQIDELIGQPTWIEAPLIQWKCPMRADIQVGDEVKLPKTITTTSAVAQNSLINHDVAFQGTFKVQNVHHIGNFRQPTGEAWVTVFDAAPTKIEAA